MKCPIDNTQMVLGQAIKPNQEYGARYIHPPALTTHTKT